jgi:hypothetical protein
LLGALHKIQGRAIVVDKAPLVVEQKYRVQGLLKYRAVFSFAFFECIFRPPAQVKVLLGKYTEQNEQADDQNPFPDFMNVRCDQFFRKPAAAEKENMDKRLQNPVKNCYSDA